MELHERIEALKFRGAAFASPRELTAALASDAALKSAIKELYKLIFRKTLSGCTNCVADAFFEIVKSKTDEMTEKAKPRFWLRAGAVLHDKNFDAGKMMSNVNITDELAIYHLSTNPECVVYFSEMPENWRELVAEAQIKASNVEETPAQTQEAPVKKTRTKKAAK